MNYFAHGCDFIDNACFLAGTAAPDWLSVVDRRVRLRSRRAELLVDDDDAFLAEFARGVVQHCQDDERFHRSLPFAELSLEFCRGLRELLPADDGFRPHFLGHILVEILLDAALIAENPQRLEQYYQVVAGLDAGLVQDAVNRIALVPTEQLTTFVRLFSQERFLWDYADDGKLLFRLNQVMRRAGLPRLPDVTADFFPRARAMVAQRRDELLPLRSPSVRARRVQPSEMQP